MNMVKGVGLMLLTIGIVGGLGYLIYSGVKKSNNSKNVKPQKESTTTKEKIVEKGEIIVEKEKVEVIEEDKKVKNNIKIIAKIDIDQFNKPKPRRSTVSVDDAITHAFRYLIIHDKRLKNREELLSYINSHTIPKINLIEIYKVPRNIEELEDRMKELGLWEDYEDYLRVLYGKT